MGHSGVTVAEDVFWRVTPFDPATCSLEPLIHASLVNPVVAAKTSRRFSHRMYGPWVEASGDAVLSSESLMLEWADEPVQDAFERVPKLLAAVRHLSGQARLTGSVQVIAVTPTLRSLVLAGSGWSTVDLDSRARGSLGATAFPFAKIGDAATLTAGEGPPPWSTFYLDAVRAHATGDWRMALLLAALAVETAAAETLAEWATARLNTLPRAPGVVQLSLAGGKAATKDAVYDALCEKTSFRHLLHERPLYFAGRSLLIANEPAYQSALRLNATRNKIAHLGGPGAGDNACFGLVKQDVETAIEGATQCLEFFGKAVPTGLDRLVMVPVLLADLTDGTQEGSA